MSGRSSPSTVFHHLVSSGSQSGPLVASNAAAVAAKRRRTLLTRRPSWSWPPPRPERGRPSTGPTCALAFALRGNGPEVTSAKMRCASGGPPARVRGRQSWRTSLKRKSVLFVPSKNSKKKIAEKFTFQNCRRPQLDVNVWNFGRELHCRSHHVHRLASVAQREEDVSQ